MADTLSRADLVERLATVSHRTWMRQKVRGAGDPAEPLSDRVTDHDREQAEDTVRELEELEGLRSEAAIRLRRGPSPPGRRRRPACCLHRRLCEPLGSVANPGLARPSEGAGPQAGARRADLPRSADGHRQRQPWRGPAPGPGVP